VKGTRPEQGLLTADNDLSRTDETTATIDAMVDGLNDHDIDNMGRFFAETFRWIGNAGCGAKNGLKEFQANWKRSRFPRRKVHVYAQALVSGCYYTRRVSRHFVKVVNSFHIPIH